MLFWQVHSGASFEVAQPIFTDPEDFKILFGLTTPPNNPAIIRQGYTAFDTTALQMKHITLVPCGVIGAHIHPRCMPVSSKLSDTILDIKSGLVNKCPNFPEEARYMCM